jgi:hypothetical protein
MTPDDVTARAVEVLVEHQRQGSHACLCGELRLGSSFPGHQVEMLAGLLADRDALGRVKAETLREAAEEVGTIRDARMLRARADRIDPEGRRDV